MLAVSTLSYVGNITYPMLKDEALSLGSHPTRPAPAIDRIRALAEGKGEYVLRRRDADALIASCPDGFATLRPPQYAFAPGERVSLDDVDIVVRSRARDGAPTEIQYEFKRGGLRNYEVIAWDRDHFVPARLPKIGEQMSIRTEAP